VPTPPLAHTAPPPTPPRRSCQDWDGTVNCSPGVWLWTIRRLGDISGGAGAVRAVHWLLVQFATLTWAFYGRNFCWILWTAVAVRLSGIGRFPHRPGPHQQVRHADNFLDVQIPALMGEVYTAYRWWRTAGCLRRYAALALNRLARSTPPPRTGHTRGRLLLPVHCWNGFGSRQLPGSHLQPPNLLPHYTFYSYGLPFIRGRLTSTAGRATTCVPAGFWRDRPGCGFVYSTMLDYYDTAARNLHSGHCHHWLTAWRTRNAALLNTTTAGLGAHTYLRPFHHRTTVTPAPDPITLPHPYSRSLLPVFTTPPPLPGSRLTPHAAHTAVHYCRNAGGGVHHHNVRVGQLEQLGGTGGVKYSFTYS